MRISWPMFCRAESASRAYQTALDLLGRKPTSEVERILAEKLAEKQKVVEAYLAQAESDRAKKADEAYASQALETDLGESR